MKIYLVCIRNGENRLRGIPGSVWKEEKVPRPLPHEFLPEQSAIEVRLWVPSQAGPSHSSSTLVGASSTGQNSPSPDLNAAAQMEGIQILLGGV